jgi:pimeloyl-ACP methyl ester carboxylesterase
MERLGGTDWTGAGVPGVRNFSGGTAPTQGLFNKHPPAEWPPPAPPAYDGGAVPVFQEGAVAFRVRPVTALTALALAGGCAGTPGRVSYTEPPPAPPVEARAVVFCADGAGGFAGTSDTLRDVLVARHVPVHVQAVDWSHGYGRVLADQVDWCHTLAEGRRLAEVVRARRADCPGQPVYLVGHSAGCAVVLSAAGLLPADSVERIVLLAPAVSAGYDLRPALGASRCGIDSFYSGRDWAWLGLGAGLVGTTDRRWEAPAGRVGFRPVVACRADVALYHKLRQHPWAPCQSWTGNTGGHHDCYRPGFLGAYVVPLLDPRTNDEGRSTKTATAP